MLFSSLVFLWYFLPAVCLLCFITKNPVWRNGVLLCASIFFYAWGEPVYVLLMLFSIALNYAFGRWIEAARPEPSGGETATRPEPSGGETATRMEPSGGETAVRLEPSGTAKGRRAARLLLTACVLLNLGLLGYFKYFQFLADCLNSLIALAGGTGALRVRDIALPVGISFYTFQALSYVVDVYRGTIRAQKNVFYLALYISFFPQLIAGPIVKYRDVCDQIRSRRCTPEKAAYGIRRFSYGLAKKMLLANTFAAAVDTALARPLPLLGTETVWLLAMLYMLQIYFDFSGYSDMAIGLGKLFGFDFMENFRYPYLSASIREFWRRWHISLSTWFKEYLYIPLGGNRKGQFKTCRNLLIVFFATGLWHGAGLTFIVWGLYHGFFLVLERGAFGRLLDRMQNGRLRIFAHLYALLVVLIGWVFFRADTLADAGVLLRQMFVWTDGVYPHSLFFNGKVLFTAVCGLILCGPLQALFPALTRHLYDETKIRTADLAVMVTLMFLCTVYLVNNTYNPFIYFRF